MKSLRTVLGAVAVFLCGAYLSNAMQSAPRESDEQHREAYRVTPWPSDTVAEPYHQLVQDHLNRMAADGWSLNSVVVGQREKMMVFERKRG